MSEKEKAVGWFDLVAELMTRVDVGGEAGRQLDITETRQGLACALKVMANHMTLKQVVSLMLDYVDLH